MDKGNPVILGISGVKNSGKTTLITKIIPLLTAMGYRIATIKHDGHDFQGDVANTDTFRHRSAGAVGTAIFSNHQYMIIKAEKTDEIQLFAHFSDMDLILLEGFKHSDYPKIEVVRKENSQHPVGNPTTFLAVATDCDLMNTPYQVIHLNDYEKIAQVIHEYIKKETI